MALNLLQRIILGLGALLLVVMVFAYPPLTIRGLVDARTHCTAQVNQQQDALLNTPPPRKADGAIDWASAFSDVPPFDFSREYQYCLRDARVDTPRLAVQVAVVALVALALAAVARFR